MSGRNPRLSQLLTGKPRILVLNKADLADENCTKVSEIINSYTFLLKFNGISDTLRIIQ